MQLRIMLIKKQSYANKAKKENIMKRARKDRQEPCNTLSSHINDTNENQIAKLGPDISLESI